MGRAAWAEENRIKTSDQTPRLLSPPISSLTDSILISSRKPMIGGTAPATATRRRRLL